MKRYFRDFPLIMGLLTLLFLCIFALIFVAPWSEQANRQMFSEILLVSYALVVALFLLIAAFRYWTDQRSTQRASTDKRSPIIQHPEGGVDMVKWEYCQVIAYGSKRDKESGKILHDKILQISGPGMLENLRGEDANINSVLNRLGAQGWEGFGHSADGLRYSVLLKRPLLD